MRHRLTKRDIGRFVCVRFHDHAENAGRLVVVEAVGRIVAYAREELRIVGWKVLDADVGGSTEWSILRKAILPDGLEFLEAVQ